MVLVASGVGDKVLDGGGLAVSSSAGFRVEVGVSNMENLLVDVAFVTGIAVTTDV